MRRLFRFGLAATATALLATAQSPRTEAKSLASSPVVSNLSSTAKAAADGLVIEVRGGGGHGGGHMGGGGGGGGHMGGGHMGVGMHGGGMHGGPVYGGGLHHGGYGFAHHHRHFVGGYYYPAYYANYDYYPRCRTVWTSYGPRRVCYRHHWHRRHYWHRRHHWHHRHYW